MTKEQTNVGINLLKIFAMIGITIIHMFCYNNVLSDTNITKVNLCVFHFESVLTTTSVNLFGIISGYLLSTKTFKINRVIKIWSQLFSVSMILLVIMTLLKAPLESLQIKTPLEWFRIVRCIFPFLSKHYWYVFTYILLLFVSPLINLVINVFDELRLKQLCIGGCIVICIVLETNPLIDSTIIMGNHWGIVWMSYLYMVGAYIKKYNISYVPRFVIHFLGCISFIGIMVIKIKGIDGWDLGEARFLNNNGILPFLLSISIFIFFVEIKIRNNKFLSYLSNVSLYVYLFQEHVAVRNPLWDILNLNNYSDKTVCILVSWMYIILIWILGIVLSIISKTVEKYLYKGLILLIKSVDNRFNIHIPI